MIKIKRAEKIEQLVILYKIILETSQFQTPTINQIIVDSIGITGLKQVKQKAWEQLQ